MLGKNNIDFRAKTSVCREQGNIKNHLKIGQILSLFITFAISSKGYFINKHFYRNMFLNSKLKHTVYIQINIFGNVCLKAHNFLFYNYAWKQANFLIYTSYEKKVKNTTKTNLKFWLSTHLRKKWEWVLYTLQFIRQQPENRHHSY